MPNGPFACLTQLISRKLVVALFVLSCGGSQVFAARPDYYAARTFGNTLQADYKARQSRALIERLDSSVMMQRIFSADVMASDEKSGLKGAWETQLLPAISRQFEALDNYKTLVVSRVVLCNDTRQLECLLLDDTGMFQLVTLHLVERSAGEIRISDLQFGGSELELTRAMRHLFLLLQVPLGPLTDPEEIELADLGKTSHERIVMAMQALGNRRPDEAFNLWHSVAPKLKETRVWRQLLARMAVSGSKSAARDIELATRHDQRGDPFLRLSSATLAQDHNRALVAIDDVLLQYRQLVFLRAQKAELLVRCGRAGEALQLAEDLCEVSPLSGSAYLAVVHSATAAKQPERAIEGIRRWSLIVPSGEIDRMLSSDPELAPFLASPPYVAWKQKALDVTRSREALI